MGRAYERNGNIVSESSPALNTVIIIQARMSSTRLAGKSLKIIQGLPVIAILVKRLKFMTHPATIVIATSEEDADDPIEAYCKEAAIEIFRGAEEDVLDRYLKAARKYSGDVIVRITGDCPLMDPRVVDQTLDYFLEHYPDFDYVSNTLKRTFPRGLDVEVFKRRALERAHSESYFTEEREHVTPYIWRHPEMFSQGNYLCKEDHSEHRWTLDTEEDFHLIKLILDELLPANPHFSMQDTLALMTKNPEWFLINAQIKQKGI